MLSTFERVVGKELDGLVKEFKATGTRVSFAIGPESGVSGIPGFSKNDPVAPEHEHDGMRL